MEGFDSHTRSPDLILARFRAYILGKGIVLTFCPQTTQVYNNIVPSKARVIIIVKCFIEKDNVKIDVATLGIPVLIIHFEIEVKSLAGIIINRSLH